MKNNIFSIFINLIFPPRCVLCGKIVSYGGQICDKCSTEAVKACTNKRIYIPKLGKIIGCYAPFQYKNSIRKAIINFKFYGKKELVEFFANIIAKQFLEIHSYNFDIITCVPLSKQRKKLRGYNQSELLAKAVSKRLNVPYKECLEKIKDNNEQHRLNEKDRQKNVKNVYIVKNKQNIYKKSILIIDDIVTTGATLGECASVMFQNDVKQVTCAAIAQVVP